MNRLFVAIPVPELILSKIFNLIDSLSDKHNDMRWEKKEKIHLTLKFIGEVPNEMVTSIVEQISFLNNFEKVKLSLTEFNFFPDGNNPKILYIGLSNNEIINQIAFKLDQRLFELGIKKSEKKLKLHLTILRIKKPVSDAFIKSVKSLNFSGLNFIVNEISLYESKLKPDGSHYKKIKKYFLN